MISIVPTTGEGQPSEATCRTDPTDWGFVVLTLREAATVLAPLNSPTEGSPFVGVSGAPGAGTIYTTTEVIRQLTECISPRPPPGPSAPRPAAKAPRGVEAMMTPKEAAAALGISVKTLMTHVEVGNVGFVNIGTRTRKIHRFNKYMLDKFVEKRQVKDFAPCPSSSVPALKSTASTSGSQAVDFLAVPKPQPKRRPTR